MKTTYRLLGEMLLAALISGVLAVLFMPMFPRHPEAVGAICILFGIAWCVLALLDSPSQVPTRSRR
jgi:uncharacterized membrane protein YgaE (UPF0421/DUF939 family)